MSLHDIVRAQGYAVIDGGLATELESKGAKLDPVLWSASVLIDNPELITQAHLDYLRAGANILLSSSYQATFSGFARARGLSAAESHALFLRSVRLARDAVRLFLAESSASDAVQRVVVAGSVGSYGAFLADGSEFRGDYKLSMTQLKDFHRPQVAALRDAAPDLLAFETVPNALEALAIADLLQKEFPSLSAYISFSCRDALHISDGTLLAEVVARLESYPQVVGIGINCTSPLHIAPLLAALRPVTRKLLLVYPNSGEVYDGEARCFKGETRAVFGKDDGELERETEKWHRLGAQCIGGCCRTTPADIARIAHTLAAVHGGKKEEASTGRKQAQ